MEDPPVVDRLCNHRMLTPRDTYVDRLNMPVVQVSWPLYRHGAPVTRGKRSPEFVEKAALSRISK